MFNYLIVAAAMAAGGAQGGGLVGGEAQVRAARAAGAIDVDGRLDEEAWQHARAIEGFIQREPRQGDDVSERTVVRILTDKDALYVGAWLYDRTPGASRDFQVAPAVTLRPVGLDGGERPLGSHGGRLDPVEPRECRRHRGATELARDSGARYLEARHVAPHPFIPHRKQQKASMILDLAVDADSQWKAFDAKLRNQVRKAEKSGLRCRTGGAEELGHFYSVFSRCMRSLGTPVYDRRFFAQVLDAFPETASVLVVEDGAMPVAAGIALEHRDTIEVPWAGSLAEYRSKCPNNMLYWEAIRHAIARGCRRFDFGRSTPGDGPYRFKEQWGAKPLPLTWEYWLADGQGVPDLSPKNEKFHAAIEVWKRLPLSVTIW